jgi:hypothetical protein
MSSAEFLRLLGKEPAETWFRTIAPKTAYPEKVCNRSRQGRDLHGLNLAVLEADNQGGSSVYYVTGNAAQGTGRSGAVQDIDVHGCPALFVEWDNRPIEWQLDAWQELKLPEPSAVVATGGKSLHCYWVLEAAMEPDPWRVLQRRLIEFAGGDMQCKNPSRVMRLPGFRYVDKATGAVSERFAELIHQGGTRYSIKEIEACLPGAPSPPAVPRSDSRSVGKKSGSFAQILARADLPLVREILRDVLQPADRFSDYDTWLSVGMVCSDLSQRSGDAEALLDTWLQWSRQMQNFDEFECYYKWQSFTAGGPSRDNLKVASLIKYIQEEVDPKWKAINPRQRLHRSINHG